MTAAAATPIRHLRPRGDGATQPTTTVELFFDLVYVYVFAAARPRGRPARRRIAAAAGRYMTRATIAAAQVSGAVWVVSTSRS